VQRRYRINPATAPINFLAISKASEARDRYDGIRSGFVIGDGLQVVNLRQRASQVAAGLRVRQSIELCVKPVVRFCRPSRSVVNQRLRSMKHRKVGIARGIVAQASRKIGIPVAEALLRLAQIGGYFRRHKSRPSRRISLIRGVRSRQALARYGMA